MNFADGRIRQVAEHVMADEQAHVTFLRAALGSAAVAKPAINLAALNVGFASQTEFITLARAFEDVGVSAYGGAAPLISSRAILASAARIALTEAQHAAACACVAVLVGADVVSGTRALNPPAVASSTMSFRGSGRPGVRYHVGGNRHGTYFGSSPVWQTGRRRSRRHRFGTTSNRADHTD